MPTDFPSSSKLQAFYDDYAAVFLARPTSRMESRQGLFMIGTGVAVSTKISP